MGKEKKHSGPERGGGGKGGKGIHKDSSSHYGYPPQQQQQRGNYNRPADKKSPMPEYTNRPRPSAGTLPPPPASNKNAPRMPRPEQISETVSALGALEAVLNSYEQLELDACENIGELLDAIMKKKMPTNTQ